MKVIFTKRFPFGKFKAICLFGRLYVKDEDNRTKRAMILRPTLYFRLIQHERTHSVQEKQLLYLFFFIWYGVEWFVKIFTEGRAYREVCFEREARANESNYDVYVVRAKLRHESDVHYYSNAWGMIDTKTQNRILSRLNEVTQLIFEHTGIKGSLLKPKWGSWCKYVFKRW